MVYLPIENHDSDSEITSYYESGKITEQEMNSHRKESSDVEDVGKSKVISLSLESGDVGKVMKMLGRLSPSRSKFNMGSLRRRKGSKAGPTFDDNENVIEVVHSSDKKLCLDNLGNSVLNLSNTRSSSLKNISTPLPPKTSLHSKTLPNSGMVSKMPISSLYFYDNVSDDFFDVALYNILCVVLFLDDFYQIHYIFYKKIIPLWCYNSSKKIH